MIIRELFTKPIDRPINGVIKADQNDPASIWQELDEYVVTGQLTDYFRRFFDAYLAGIDNPNDPVITSRMGVWVSGFFGSGKSHFIKILSYLLENVTAQHPATGVTRQAISFFDEGKVHDAMLRADMVRATQGSADVILFNIDAKADSKSDRDVILQVFLRVFNEKMGYSGDAPHIANMERYLAEQGAYDAFKSAFETSYGSPWLKARDAVDFLRDHVVTALSQALQMTEDSAGAWFDNARDTYRINIQNFAKLVKDYLDTKPVNHRLVFLVDEVGQFIGENTQLMLTLQTITEQLGTVCGGRAWVVVTSQEDLDAAIGEANKAKTQDFSKIQGRFHTRLSLASSNTDEVVGKRLLDKTEDAHKELRDVFAKKGDIINNQLAFGGESVALRSYRDAADYVANYPFVPYQFFLLSKVFEAIRRHGATGKHLAKGERSLLDAFQSAAKNLANEHIDALVPLYDFYPSIESFLDSAIRYSIDNAERQVGSVFEAFDILLLKSLFLIRYIPEIVKGTVDNIATLCVDEVDCDKLQLKRRIQESLARLEKQSLVSRNGDEWIFLTNEEQDIAREIAHETVSHDALSRTLSDLLFDQVLEGRSKVRHRDSKADYDFNRWLDAKPYRNTNHELTFEIISPLNDDAAFFNDSKCRLYSAAATGRVILVLGHGERLYEELQMYLKVETYITAKSETASHSAKKILMLKKDENRSREERLRKQLDDLLADAACYVQGEPVTLKASTALTLLDEAVNFLVTNTYNKLSYLQPCANPYDEIRAVLTADSVAQQSLLSGNQQVSALAMSEVRQWLDIRAKESQVLLEEVVRQFSGIPYGWKPDWEIVLLVARLFMAGEIKLMMDGSDLDGRQAVEPLGKTQRFKSVAILKRKVTSANEQKRARDLYKQLFSEVINPEDGEDAIVATYRKKLTEWDKKLASFSSLAAQPHYPGYQVITDLQARLRKQCVIKDSFAFIEAMLNDKEAWLDSEETLHDLEGFYADGSNQLATWRRLLTGLNNLQSNRDKLDADPKAAAALKALEAIRDNPSPYGQVRNIDALLSTVDAINQALATGYRERAQQKIGEKLTKLQHELDTVQAPADVRNQVLRPLQLLRGQLEHESSISRIYYLQDQSSLLFSTANDQIESYQIEQQKKQPAPPVTAVVPPPVTGTSGSNNAAATLDRPATSTSPAPVFKPTTVFKASDVATAATLESVAEVEAYLTQLRSKLMSVVQAGRKISIE